jgi:hypothetical protein
MKKKMKIFLPKRMEKKEIIIKAIIKKSQIAKI